MLLSIRWLQEFIDIDAPVHDLAHRLTMSGFEVECVTEIGPQWDHIIVAEVLESTRHPDADKLTVNAVHTGSQTLQIVCGAPNVRAGQKVALALPGAAFPGGLVIKRSKIRGQLSEGMLCSAAELSLGDPDGGILILDDSLTLGVPLADALQLRDTVLDVSITPNRADCLSVLGMAREIAALYDLPLKAPACELPAGGPTCANLIAVDIQVPDACPRYCAAYACNITVGPSPLWMRRRLENCGIRSINNIVDITNYVLLEWGQPLHAFDYNLIDGKQIVVRAAHHGERFTTLDTKEHTLPAGALMICDACQSRALAGIMGGLDSSITAGTRTVLLESAYFTPGSIAATGRSLGIKTEASQRFEKGVDINGVVPALKRAASLIVELNAGQTSVDICDCYPAPQSAPRPIDVSVDTLNMTLGLRLDAETISTYLVRLQMRVVPNGSGMLAVIPPSYRYDIVTPVDVIEEVARLNGYDRIPVTYPNVPLCGSDLNPACEVAEQARRLLAFSGFSEVINYSFQDPDLLSGLRFSTDDERGNPVRLLNPLSASQSVMRTSILGSLLQNLQHNLRSNRCTACSLFEISNIFLQNSSGAITEKRLLAGLIYGTLNTDTWALPSRNADIFDIKGCIEALLTGLRIQPFCFESGSLEPFLMPQSSLRIYVGDCLCGNCGTLHPDITERFDAAGPVHVFELDFSLLCAYHKEYRPHTPFSRFPAVQRDLALLIDQSISAADVTASLAAFNCNLLRQWNLFDFYQGGSIPPGKKSIAFRLLFQSDERTLTDAEVNKAHDKLLDSLRKQLGAELR